jgi:hypothetical protein
VNPWWWVPIGLAAWFLVSIVAALLIGPVLKRSARSQDSLRPEPERTPDEGELSEDERQASL